MKKKTLLLTLFIIASFNNLYAQTVPILTETKPEPERHKWEVALNILPIIRDIKAGEAGLMLRKNIIQNDKLMAYRFALYTSNSFQTNEDWTKKRPFFNTIDFIFGKEWQKQTGKYMVFYGVDLGTGIIYNRFVGLPSFIDDNGIAYNGRGSLLSFRANIGPFLGVKYFFSSTFALSIESKFTYQLSTSKNIAKYYDNNWNVKKSETGNYYTSHDFALSPLYVFRFSYFIK